MGLAFFDHIPTDWNFPIIFLEVAIFLIAAAVLLYRYDAGGVSQKSAQLGDLTLENEVIPGAIDSVSGRIVYTKDLREACGGNIYSAWLLASRTISFLYLLIINIVDAAGQANLLKVYYYYTEWTLTLLVFYFGVASCVSLSEFLQFMKKGTENSNHILDTEAGYPVLRSISRLGSDGEVQSLDPSSTVEVVMASHLKGINMEGASEAGWFGYSLQALFQMAVPAVFLTDGVYWLLLVPMFPKGYPRSFMEWNLHGINIIFILVEFSLNSMPFPWFRGAYFILYSAMFTIFQWTIHGIGLVNWPYPYYFMKIDTPEAPFWYFFMAIVHVACVLLSLLIAGVKHKIYVHLFSSKAATNAADVRRPLLETST